MSNETEEQEVSLYDYILESVTSETEEDIFKEIVFNVMDNPEIMTQVLSDFCKVTAKLIYEDKQVEKVEIEEEK